MIMPMPSYANVQGMILEGQLSRNEGKKVDTGDISYL